MKRLLAHALLWLRYAPTSLIEIVCALIGLSVIFYVVLSLMRLIAVLFIDAPFTFGWAAPPAVMLAIAVVSANRSGIVQDKPTVGRLLFDIVFGLNAIAILQWFLG